jgi:hypothetical protein
MALRWRFFCPAFFWPVGRGLASAEIFRQARLQTHGQDSALSRRNAPELWLTSCPSPLKRAQGRPGAGWHPWPPVRRNCTRMHRGMTTGEAETSRPSLRDGLTAYAELSPETNSSCLRRFADSSEGFTRLGNLASAKLNTSNGCQDHTVLPYAATSLVLRRKQSLTAKAALRSLSHATPSRPPLPALHVS